MMPTVFVIIVADWDNIQQAIKTPSIASDGLHANGVRAGGTGRSGGDGGGDDWELSVLLLLLLTTTMID